MGGAYRRLDQDRDSVDVAGSDRDLVFLVRHHRAAQVNGRETESDRPITGDRVGDTRRGVATVGLPRPGRVADDLFRIDDRRPHG